MWGRGPNKEESIVRKRKLTEVEVGDNAEDSFLGDTGKRTKYEAQGLQNKEELELIVEEWEKDDVVNQKRSAAAKRQADREQ
ncbi:hypothetical protein EPI10_033527 [Gossypium australe]|uniref:Uncharacterized protein n=1 Tax=Gossypium australe TaxID=47621 RepID=A0A5B6X7V1_9ROSI|nr:hypothetical protein EPI10_033527 [Gossypium australe]